MAFWNSQIQELEDTTHVYMSGFMLRCFLYVYTHTQLFLYWGWLSFWLLSKGRCILLEHHLILLEVKGRMWVYYVPCVEEAFSVHQMLVFSEALLMQTLITERWFHKCACGVDIKRSIFSKLLENLYMYDKRPQWSIVWQKILRSRESFSMGSKQKN